MVWYKSPSFSEPPDTTVRLSSNIHNYATHQRDIASWAHQDLMIDIASGHIDPDNDCIAYRDLGMPILTIKQVEKNIIAWYQFWDSVVCGEIKVDAV